MKVTYDPEFYNRIKKLNVRIRKNLRERILLFSKRPNDPLLNNHPLEREYEGLRSIDITADCRAIYEEINEPDQEQTAYFVKIGTHDQLYTKKPDS